MTSRRLRALAITLCLAPPAAAATLGTAFTYQGQLKDSGQPANGLYDLQFCLFDTSSNPIPLGCAADAGDVPVDAGLFSVALDFGSGVFSGQERYLELSVRPAASAGAYTTLAPRQQIRPTPEALRSNAAAAAPWGGLTGIPTGFADGVDDSGGGGTVTSIASGTGLTGGPITTTGTLDIANGGVGTAQIAAGAVGSTQINTAQVQQRVGGTCVLGTYLRGINTDGSVLCSELPGVSTITRVNDPSNLTGEYSSIAIGGDGLPVISYYDGTARSLKVAKCANRSCTGSATITSVDDPADTVGLFTSIAIGADGRPVISYQNFTTGTLKVAKCANAACSGSATITTVDDPANRVGSQTSLAIGTGGLPVISYYDETAGALKVAKCTNAACTGVATITTVADLTGNVGAYNSIAIGADGLPVISYSANTANALRVVKCAQLDCSDSSSIATITLNTVDANSPGLYNSLAIGADGLPVISYWDFAASALRVAKCANPACSGSATITTVDDPANQVGQYSSIDIGADGFPVISYFDNTAIALKVAKCTNAACTGSATITTVDDAANNVGYFTSIAIGIDGLPVISYYDNGAGALRVAKCGSPSCR